MKYDLNNIQSKYIKTLENVLNEATENHRKIRNRIEELEFDNHLVRETRYGYDEGPSKKKGIIKIPITRNNQ
jgi:hypothetical protein